MASIIQFKYTTVRRREHTTLIQHQRPLPGCLLKENCTCYELERGIQLLLTALPNWFWLTRFKMKIEMLLPFFFFFWCEFALLSTKWVSFLVITEKCIITFDYAAIKGARWQSLALVRCGGWVLCNPFVFGTLLPSSGGGGYGWGPSTLDERNELNHLGTEGSGREEVLWTDHSLHFNPSPGWHPIVQKPTLTHQPFPHVSISWISR